MGDVIQGRAAVNDILEDTGKALDESRARGGTIQERAESSIAPVMAMRNKPL